MLATNALVRISPEVELLLPLPEGSIVRTWDGSLGHVAASTHAWVDVVYPARLVGRGPWRYDRCQVEPLTADEVNADVYGRAAEVSP